MNENRYKDKTQTFMKIKRFSELNLSFELHRTMKNVKTKRVINTTKKMF